MPRILTKLRISEVSAVDKAAGEDCKIVLMKRDDSDNVYATEWYKESVAKAEHGNREHIAKFDRSFNGIMAKADAKSRDLADGGGGASDHHASKVADLLVEAGSHPDRASALQHLLHKPAGQALLQRMHKAADQTAKETPMGKTETLRAIAKAGGIIAVAKAIIDENRSYGITEHEFVELIGESAQAEFPSLSKAQAFSKLYTEQSERGRTLQKSVAICKAMPFQVDVEPLVVGGADTRDLSDTSKAIEQLKALGARKWPSAKESDQFERALTDPANAVLARRAVPRPQPTTSYPFPK
jgi:hypothetical protein